MPILSSHWVNYPWKNELKTQAERVVASTAEILSEDDQTEHHPMAMLERALVLAAFRIRRMIEKRVVTDAIAALNVKVRSYPARNMNFRRPFTSSTGSNTYSNYELGSPAVVGMSLKQLCNEIIHASQLMVISGEQSIEDGLLFASDEKLSSRLIHLTAQEFTEYVNLVLADHITVWMDEYDPANNKVRTTRS